MYEEFESYLNFDFSSDYWSDVGLDIACEMLNKFSKNDWTSLSNNWTKQIAIWKERCAETLDSGQTDDGLALLLAMIYDSNVDVVIAAVDSLRSWPKNSIHLTDLDIEQLKGAQGRASSIGKIMLSKFLDAIMR